MDLRGFDSGRILISRGGIPKAHRLRLLTEGLHAVPKCLFSWRARHGRSPYQDSRFQRAWLEHNITLRDGILMSIGNFPGNLSQQIFKAGITLISREIGRNVSLFVLQLAARKPMLMSSVPYRSLTASNPYRFESTTWSSRLSLSRNHKLPDSIRAQSFTET